MKVFGNKKQSGFSLVELMIVVGIIGILATLALPRFKQFQSKAKLAEGMNILQYGYGLEHSYQLQNNQFISTVAIGADITTATTNICAPATGATADLGFFVDPCTPGPIPRFQYQITAPTADTFIAVARTGAGPLNRICLGNPQFSISVNHLNQTANAPGAASPAITATNGPGIPTVLCPN